MTFSYTSKTGTFLLFLVVVLIVLMPVASKASGLSLDALLDRVEGQFDATCDFEASFIQETSSKSMAREESEQGRLFYKKPIKMLWLYDKPQAKKLVVNSEEAWLFLPDDGVAYFQKTERLVLTAPAVRLLSGLRGVRKDFQVRYATPHRVDETGNYLVQLVPHDRNAGFVKALVEIDRATYGLVQVKFEDAYGNTTRIRLSGIRLNRKLPDDMFRFVPPAGVEVFPLP